MVEQLVPDPVQGNAHHLAREVLSHLRLDFDPPLAEVVPWSGHGQVEGTLGPDRLCAVDDVPQGTAWDDPQDLVFVADVPGVASIRARRWLPQRFAAELLRRGSHAQRRQVEAGYHAAQDSAGGHGARAANGQHLELHGVQEPWHEAVGGAELRVTRHNKVPAAAVHVEPLRELRELRVHAAVSHHISGLVDARQRGAGRPQSGSRGGSERIPGQLCCCEHVARQNPTRLAVLKPMFGVGLGGVVFQVFCRALLDNVKQLAFHVRVVLAQ